MSDNSVETVKEKISESNNDDNYYDDGDDYKPELGQFILLTQLAKIEKTDKPIELPKPEYTYYTFKSQRHTNFAVEEYVITPEESAPLKDKA